MYDVQIQRRRESTVLFETLLTMAATGMVALIFCLMAGLSIGLGVIVMAASALLVGGIVYSILEMHRLATKNRELELLAKNAELEACEARLAAQRAQAEERIVEGPIGSEPYRHHEHHVESPGLDQGQLTTGWYGTTPFFDRARALKRPEDTRTKDRKN